MGIPSIELVNAFDQCGLMAHPIPGYLEYLDIEGIQGRYSPVRSHPLLNIIVKTNLTTENVDAAIQTVTNQFSDWNKAFGWRVSDSSTPSDLAQHLEAAGFAKTTEFAGMSLDINHPITANPTVQIRQMIANESTLALASDLYHRAFPMPKEIADDMVIVIDAMKGVNYFAYVEDSDDPVAIASMFNIPNRSMALMGGAATLPEYRGRGIYTSLVASRFKDASNDGVQTAIVQADRSSSAPICKNLGFVEKCAFEIYVWTPSDS